MKTVWGEMKLAVRTLARAPGFALVVVLTMGLGIGANTAIFSVVHSVLLQPLPYDDGEDLVWLRNRYLPDGDLGAISGGEFWEYRRNQPALEGLAAVSTLTASLTGLPTPVQLRGLSVSPGYFALLRTGPVLGRAFLEDEEQPGRADVTVISHGLWQTAFGSDPDMLGRQILLNGASVSVVGVMGPDHEALRSLLSPGSRTDYWVPMILDPTTFSSETVERHGLWVLGRLADSADRGVAEVGLLEAVHRVEASYPGISNEGSREVAVLTLRERVVGDVTGVLFLLSCAVAMVLALACMNVTNLLIARGETRTAEIAVRAALGAGRSRLMLHVIAESTIIGLVGGVVGLGLAVGGRDLVFALDPQAAVMGEGVGFGLPVLAFSLGLSIWPARWQERSRAFGWHEVIWRRRSRPVRSAVRRDPTGRFSSGRWSSDRSRAR